MARTAQVQLPKRQSVGFPDRCPVCGKQHPGHTVKLESLLAPLLPVSKPIMQRWAPELAICREHVGRLRRARLSDALAFAGLSLSAMALMVYLATRFEMFAAGWWSWVIVLLAGLVLPRALMLLLARPLFQLQSDDEYVVFLLRNHDYAEEFAALNESLIYASRQRHPFRR